MYMCMNICIYMYTYIYIYIYVPTRRMILELLSSHSNRSVFYLSIDPSFEYASTHTDDYIISLSFALPAHVTFPTLPYCLHSSWPCDRANVLYSNVCGFMNAHVSHNQTLFAGGAGYSCGHCDHPTVVTVIILIFSHFTFIAHPFVFQMLQWLQHPLINGFFLYREYWKFRWPDAR